MTTSEQATATFDEVMAAWHQEPVCEVVDADTGERICSRPATWRWRFHDCTRGILCWRHVEDWLTRVSELELPDTCSRCGKTFHCLDDVATVVPL